MVSGVKPFQDIDGDGKWRIIAVESMTGKLKLDLPGNYLAGLCDLDGDGTVKLFATPTTAKQIHSVGRLKIYSYQQGKLSVS